MKDLKELLSRMTLDQKIGQLAQYNANVLMDTDAEITGPRAHLGLTPEQTSYVGSVLNFKNAKDVYAIQKDHLEKDPNKIPLLFMMDVIHGYRTIFPIPMAMGCSFDTELMEACSAMAAREASVGGVQVTFTPMVDYARDARWGRVMETCGEDPMLNGMMGAAQVRAFQGDDLKKPGTLATCVKHFAAYGGAEAGKDYNCVELSEHTLREFYLPAYKACIDAGTTMLMPSFNTLNGVPSVANSWLMNDILRDEWGFKGVVISDYNALGELLVHGVAGTRKDAARMAFACGCDIEMCSSTYAHHLKELVEEGVFTQEQIDAAVLKVLELKDRLGLFEDPYRGAENAVESDAFLTPENRALVRKAAAESAVLLKNDGILPLNPGIRKLALIGPMADEHGIVGSWICNGRAEESVTVRQGLEAALPNTEITVVAGCGKLWNDQDRSGFAAAVEAAKDADVVILCLGEPQEYSGEGNSRGDLVLPGVQDELAKAVAAVNPNTLAVTFSGRPLVLTELNNTVKAILHMWMPGTEGGNAAADLLLGKANPCGKLTMSFPKGVGQCPIYYNHTMTGRPKRKGPDEQHVGYCCNYIGLGNLPLYSFGHGLSYSDFRYEDLKLSQTEMTESDTITVEVTVYNNSDVAGKETVMLYLRDLVASNARPIQQLAAFQKVEFAPFERKTLTFTVKEEMLRFWNNSHKFVSEPGDFEISTGWADHLIHTKRFTLK